MEEPHTKASKANNWCKEYYLPPNSEGNSNTSKDNKQSVNLKGNGQGQSKDVIKGPPKPQIPMQYSSNQTITDEDEDAQTFLTFLSNSNFKSNIVKTHKAHTNYIAMLTNINHGLFIIDGGADSHVGGKMWLPLIPLSGPNVRFANITGFD